MLNKMQSEMSTSNPALWKSWSKARTEKQWNWIPCLKLPIILYMTCVTVVIYMLLSIKKTSRYTFQKVSAICGIQTRIQHYDDQHYLYCKVTVAESFKSDSTSSLSCFYFPERGWLLRHFCHPHSFCGLGYDLLPNCCPGCGTSPLSLKVILPAHCTKTSFTESAKRTFIRQVFFGIAGLQF